MSSTSFRYLPVQLEADVAHVVVSECLLPFMLLCFFGFVVGLFVLLCFYDLWAQFAPHGQRRYLSSEAVLKNIKELLTPHKEALFQ